MYITELNAFPLTRNIVGMVVGVVPERGVSALLF